MLDIKSIELTSATETNDENRDKESVVDWNQFWVSPVDGLNWEPFTLTEAIFCSSRLHSFFFKPGFAAEFIPQLQKETPDSSTNDKSKGMAGEGKAKTVQKVSKKKAKKIEHRQKLMPIDKGEGKRLNIVLFLNA